jgi:hypothetical protein
MHTATKNRLLQTKKARSLDSTIAKVRKHNYDQAVDHTVIHVEKKKILVPSNRVDTFVKRS